MSWLDDMLLEANFVVENDFIDAETARMIKENAPILDQIAKRIETKYSCKKFNHITIDTYSPKDGFSERTTHEDDIGILTLDSHCTLQLFKDDLLYRSIFLQPNSLTVLRGIEYDILVPHRLWDRDNNFVLRKRKPWRIVTFRRRDP